MTTEEKLQRKFYNACEVKCAGCSEHLGYRADYQYGSADIYCDPCARTLADSIVYMGDGIYFIPEEGADAS